MGHNFFLSQSLFQGPLLSISKKLMTGNLSSIIVKYDNKYIIIKVMISSNNTYLEFYNKTDIKINTFRNKMIKLKPKGQYTDRIFTFLSIKILNADSLFIFET